MVSRRVVLVGGVLAALAAACRDAPSSAGDPSPASRPPAASAEPAGASSRSARRRPPARPSTSSRPAAPAFRLEATPEIRRPQSPACTFRSESWGPPKGYRAALHMHAKAPPYAYLRGGAVQLVVPEGEDEDAVVELERDGLVIRARVRGDVLEERIPSSRLPAARRPFVLRPTRARLLAGVVAVTPETMLGWRSAAVGRLTVTLPDTTVRFAEEAPVEVPCEELGLDAVAFDPRSVLPDVPADAPERRLRIGGRIRVAASADDKPSAWIRPLGGDVRAVELSRTKRRVQILLERPDYLLVGWIKRRHLAGDELAPLLGAAGLGLDGLGDDSLGALPLTRPELVECRCAADVPLVADMSRRAPSPKVYGANYAVVGRISRGNSFRLRREKGPLWELRLGKPLEGLSLSRSRLAVPRDSVASCQQRAIE